MIKALAVFASVAALGLVTVQGQLNMEELMDGLLGGDGSIDLGALEEWGNQLDELSKDCDTEKLSSMAEACGNSMEAAMKTCTDECKALFAFMGESGGCGDLYDAFGLGDIEKVCNGGSIEDILAPVTVPGVTASPDAPAVTASPDAPAVTASPDAPAVTASPDAPAVGSNLPSTTTTTSPSLPISKGTMASTLVLLSGLVLLA